MAVNIGKSTDPFYRYRRPLSIIEHKLGKTIIINLNEIANALHTKPLYLVYYFKLKKSVSVTKRLEINGIITKLELETLINQFIDEYILCNICGYPELITIKSEKSIYFRCDACGNIINIVKNKFTKIFDK